ncbi:MAG: hypothetical protein QHC65_16270 [Sphingomonas sp.]|nr:hypothetical protein [Sphingomonas sp.]MDX3885980.1 hypothetical protein [Sphingomonas sp.]
MSNAILLQPLDMVAISASGEVGTKVAANLGNDYAGVIWEHPAGAGTRTITIDLGADRVVDTIMLFQILPVAANLTLAVDAATAAQGPSFPAGSWSAAAQPLTTATDQIPTAGKQNGLWRAPAGAAPPAARYWRLKIAGTSAVTSIARLLIGRGIQLDRNFVFGAKFGVKDFGAIDFSARGVLIRRRAKKLRTLGLSFPHIRRDEAEGRILPLLEIAGNTDVVGIVTNPDADPLRGCRMYCGTILPESAATIRNAAAWECGVNMVSLF